MDLEFHSSFHSHITPWDFECSCVQVWPEGFDVLDVLASELCTQDCPLHALLLQNLLTFCISQYQAISHCYLPKP